MNKRIIALLVLCLALLGGCSKSVDTSLKEQTTYEVGDILDFGDHNWIVLDKENDELLLISEDIYECKVFDQDSNEWEDSDIKAYLNDEFLNNNFSLEKQEGMSDKGYGKVFLLSYEEAEEYFEDDASRIAKYRGQPYSWYLRSPGYTSDHVMRVGVAGRITENGEGITEERGIRPAIWIDRSVL